MSDALVELTADTFDEAVGTGTVLVDFWAPWCGPCRMQTPILEQLAADAGDELTVAKVNVDVAPTLAARFGVQSIPTLLVFKDGELAEKLVGLQQAPALKKALGI